MPRLRQLTAKELIKILMHLGFQQTRSKGSHFRFAHFDGRKTTVPVHGNDPIGTGLLLKIIKKDLNISRDEFEKLIQEIL